MLAHWTPTQQLLPSLGYFGDPLSDALVLPLAGRVKGVRLLVEDPLEHQILNLQSVALWCDEAVVDSSHAVANQSSTYPGTEEDGPAQLLQGRGIHTQAEACAWWEVQFERPVDATRLVIGNRRDEWGCRSRRLQVLVQLEQEPWRRIHQSGSADQALSCLLAAQALTHPWPAQMQTDAAALRATVLARLAQRILDRSVVPTSLPWLQILPWIDIWTTGPFTLDEEVIVAARLSCALGIETIASFDAKLRSRADILRLNQRLDQIGALYGTGQYVVSRHGVQRSVLRSRAMDYMAHLQRVIAHLEALDRAPMIAYGSLLGAVRDHAFIAHDDDVDVLYRSPARTPDEMRADLARVSGAMQDLGYGVQAFDKHYNLHVIDTVNDVSIDIFPCWQRGDEIHLHMEEMRIRGIPASVMYPRASISLYGLDVPTPGQAQEFLQHRYGCGWTKSDPFFEWPWQLNAAQP